MDVKRSLILFIMSWICFGIVCAERRCALVIGNSEYGKNNFLDNPIHDAEDVAMKLKECDFEVIKLTDGTLREMYEAICNFGEKVSHYDVALFYYSGHALQSHGENYLMPIDAELKSEADVKYSCLPLNLLLDKLEESNCPMKIIVLDACRNNPFLKRLYRGVQHLGLTTVNPPKGTCISYSTAEGSVAHDGTGRNSPYTSAFLEILDVPGLSLFDFFNLIGNKVMDKTAGEQDPCTYYSTIRGKFYFNREKLNPMFQKLDGLD